MAFALISIQLHYLSQRGDDTCSKQGAADGTNDFITEAFWKTVANNLSAVTVDGN